MAERIGDQDILLTFQEAAELLRVSRATMYRILASGDLIGHKVGRSWRFYKADLHQFVLAHREQHNSARDNAVPTVFTQEKVASY